MAEVTRRSFDLKSWQGLTLVLKVARESHLSPSAYADFRNLVLEYAQQKGTDAVLKAKIDAIIATFDDPASTTQSDTASEEKKASHERLGRRVIPTFVVKPKVAQEISHQKTVPEPQPVAHSEKELPQVAEEALVPPPPSVSSDLNATEKNAPQAVEKEPTAVKSVDEHKTRILEIKRQVNSLVKNPIGLVDQGNQIGREYMVALLSALKATNPGSTHALPDAMEALEVSYEKILRHVSEPQQEAQVSPSEPPAGVTSGERVHDDHTIEEKEETVVPPPLPPLSVPEPISEPEPQPEPEQIPAPEVVEVAPPISQVADVPLPPVEEVPHAPLPEVKEDSADTALTPDEKRWSEEGGDSNIQEQLKALREQLKSVEGAPKAIHGGKHSLIPSLLEIEDAPPHHTDVAGTEWDPYTAKERDELSPAALTERPLSSMTGITLDTPQSELMSPDVTMALGKLLHEWKIFASSGLFGMGPGGIEHPLYVKLARLSMAEIITGRYEDADMKVVHAIKDYVDAWRHEQGIAYSPSETFEHYLRRVAQRILNRQTGVIPR